MDGAAAVAGDDGAGGGNGRDGVIDRRNLSREAGILRHN